MEPQTTPPGQATIETSDLDSFPPTVHDHTEHSDGLTLHTIDNDPDSDLEMYFDEREMHRSDNPPSDD